MNTKGFALVLMCLEMKLVVRFAIITAADDKLKPLLYQCFVVILCACERKTLEKEPAINVIISH